MEIIQSGEFTTAVEQIIINYFKDPQNQNNSFPNFQILAIQMEKLQQQYLQTYMSLLEYLKSSFEALREQLTLDINLNNSINPNSQSQSQTLQQSQNQQQVLTHPLVKVNEDPKIQDKINQLNLRIYEIDNNLRDQVNQLMKRVEIIAFNKDEIIEEIRSFDCKQYLDYQERLEAQWQGIANISDEFWNMKKLQQQSPQKKKFSLF